MTTTYTSRMIERPRKILIVEGNRDDQDRLSAIVNAGGWGVPHIVARITDAEHALDGCGQYSLIILDLLLPDSAGATATLSAVRVTHANVPVVVVTGIADPKVLQEAEGYHWPIVSKDSETFDADLSTEIERLLGCAEQVVTTRPIRQAEPVATEHYATPLDAGAGLATKIFEKQGITALLLTLMIVQNIYRDYRYNADQESRTQSIERTAVAINSKFETVAATMSDAKAARAEDSKLLRELQRDQRDFQRQIASVIDAVKLLLERIERSETSSANYGRRADGGEDFKTQGVGGSWRVGGAK